ncbi:Trypsin-4 [Smittium mucronatum]|uniref:Trypsin-4 n=1 Tax=Smittium mucronatum TaxID=133383 RepID=A0A1R0GS77_9FUNG|nr:Trypsin-4 [Smittium mucronatum]
MVYFGFVLFSALPILASLLKGMVIDEDYENFVKIENLDSVVDDRPQIDIFENENNTDGTKGFEYVPEVVKVLGIYEEIGLECAGTLITPQHILTSASCLERSGKEGGFLPPELLAVSVPAFKIGVLFKVENVTVHESYNNYTMTNDIALIKLSFRLDPHNFDFPKIYNADLERRMRLEIYGYDLSSIDNYQLLPRRRVPISTSFVRESVCGRYILKKDLSCLFVRNRKSICINNRGGPVFRILGSRQMAGIISHWISVDASKSFNIAPIYNCAKNGDVIVYTLLKPYINWMSKNTGYSKDYFKHFVS